MQQKINRFVKETYRFLRYRNQRNKVFREKAIRQRQDEALAKHFPADTEQLIVFLVPGSDWATGKDKITGGTISIVSLCEQTKAIKDLHGCETIMCTLGNEHLFVKHTMFDNNTDVFRFSQFPDHFARVKRLIIHVPEFMVGLFIDSLGADERNWMKQVEQLQVNVMNQNIMLMPGREEIQRLEEFTPHITITTAHQKYCNPAFREKFGYPIHKFSVWISPEQYQFRTYDQKENLMVVSPDPHPRKEEVIDRVRASGTEVVVIKNLTYAEYKKLISRAKWSLTFGEGLDGYLIEPVFSGAIGFAIYNEQFFTPDFAGLATIYPSEPALLSHLVNDKNRLDEPSIFQSTLQPLFDTCAKHYSKEQYLLNIVEFYKGNYTCA